MPGAVRNKGAATAASREGEMPEKKSPVHISMRRPVLNSENIQLSYLVRSVAY